ncbi:MAG: FAD-dependent oxidoreductase [Solirubrobacterales bacterium]
MTRKAADISHWFAQIYGDDAKVPLRPCLEADREADVCIVGAGYTGLWTAYALKRAAPELDVVLVEAATAGFGASGRNGGAVIAQINGSRNYWAERGGRDGAIALERELQATVDEVGAAVARENIDCSFSKNGVVMAARTPLELERFRRSVEVDQTWGFGPKDVRMLDAAELAERMSIVGGLGARFTPHCASIHPGRLVRGLADAVERLGATIYEDSPVLRIEAGAAHTRNATVRAKYVMRATEAYTESVRGQERLIVPVHTSMLATEKVPDEIWAEIGWSGREALLAEHPFLHLQHTADGRITIGGDDNRIPYHWASKVKAIGAAPQKVAEMYRAELVRLFPALQAVKIEHTWQGVFGAPRNWAPSVGLDTATGLCWAGGYVGEGVAPANLAGRTMADLILGRDTNLTRLPWVERGKLRRWEPEPLRAAGAGIVWSMRALGDGVEKRTGKRSRVLELGNKLAGYGGHLG